MAKNRHFKKKAHSAIQGCKKIHFWCNKTLFEKTSFFRPRPTAEVMHDIKVDQQKSLVTNGY